MIRLTALEVDVPLLHVDTVADVVLGLVGEGVSEQRCRIVPGRRLSSYVGEGHAEAVLLD